MADDTSAVKGAEASGASKHRPRRFLRSEWQSLWQSGRCHVQAGMELVGRGT